MEIKPKDRSDALRFMILLPGIVICILLVMVYQEVRFQYISIQVSEGILPIAKVEIERIKAQLNGVDEELRNINESINRLKTSK